MPVVVHALLIVGVKEATCNEHLANGWAAQRIECRGAGRTTRCQGDGLGMAKWVKHTEWGSVLRILSYEAVISDRM